jgi:hypothetical protein
MKRFLTASAIACALSVAALAGEIPSDGAPQPPPQQTTGTTNPGQIPTDGLVTTISDAALSALLTALGLVSF